MQSIHVLKLFLVFLVSDVEKSKKKTLKDYIEIDDICFYTAYAQISLALFSFSSKN